MYIYKKKKRRTDCEATRRAQEKNKQTAALVRIDYSLHVSAATVVPRHVVVVDTVAAAAARITDDDGSGDMHA